MDIIVRSDERRVRSIAFDLASGGNVQYGNPNDDEFPMMHRFNFSEQVDLLAVYGWVMADADDPETDHISSIGFIVNSCPIRDLLAWEKEHLYGADDDEVTRLDSEDGGRRKNGKRRGGVGKGAFAAILIFSILTPFIICAAIYYILKRRGMICKKKTPTSGAELSVGGMDNSVNNGQENRVPSAMDDSKLNEESKGQEPINRL